MKKTVFTIALLFIIFFSCKKKDDVEENLESNLPEITGFTFHNYEGNSIGSYGGQVNNHVGVKDFNDTNSKYMIIFPNPVEDNLTVYGFKYNSDSIKKVWMKQAKFTGELPESFYLEEVENQPYTGGESLLNAEVFENVYRLNFENIPDGYYRIYIKTEGELYFENLMVNRKFWGYKKK